MRKFGAATMVAGRFVQFAFEAESFQDAWQFAVDNLYPKDSTKLLHVWEDKEVNRLRATL